MRMLAIGQVLVWIAISQQLQAEAPRPIRESIDHATQWILSQQSSDGGWKSETYGVMKSGVGTTALVLHALAEPLSETTAEPTAASDSKRSESKGAEEVQSAIARGIDFLSMTPRPDGLVGPPHGRADSPVYATALVLLADVHLKRLQPAQKKALCEALKKAQQIPQNGFSEQCKGRGGWGIEPLPAMSDSNPANISVTRFAVTALTASQAIDTVKDSVLIQELHQFLKNCRHRNSEPDAGFWFTPDPLDHLNKLGVISNQSELFEARTYLSTTADGLAIAKIPQLSMTPSDIAAIEATLDMQHFPELAPVVIPEDSQLGPLQGLYFYSAMTFSDVTTHLNEKANSDKAQKILETLQVRQHSDGSFSNPVAWMREDDPLIATSMALLALKRFETSEPAAKLANP